MEREHSAPVVSTAKAVSLVAVGVVASLWLHVTVIDRVGFADGHRTDYERWSVPLVQVAIAGMLALSVVFATLAASRTESAAAARWFRVAVVVLVVLLVGAFVLVPVIGQQVLHLEHGQGG